MHRTMLWYIDGMRCLMSSMQDDWADTIDNSDTPFVPPTAHLEAVLGACMPPGENSAKGGHPLTPLLQSLRYTEEQVGAPDGVLPQPLVRLLRVWCCVYGQRFGQRLAVNL